MNGSTPKAPARRVTDRHALWMNYNEIKYLQNIMEAFCQENMLEKGGCIETEASLLESCMDVGPRE